MKLFSEEWFAPDAAPDGVRFRLRGLTMGESLRLKSIASSSGDTSEEMYRHIYGCGLLGWEGIEDAAGAPVPCEPDAALRLPPTLAEDIAQHIIALSGLSGDEEKNLSSPSMSTGNDGDSTAGTADGAGIAT